MKPYFVAEQQKQVPILTWTKWTRAIGFLDTLLLTPLCWDTVKEKQ